MMNKPSTERPGVRERHLLRKRGNPLFDEAQRAVSNEDIVTARLEDGMEKDRFMEAFQALVQKAVDLKPNAPSETVLEIKEQLDLSYQQACALPGDQSEIKAAIGKLVAVIMRSIWAGVGADSFAQQQLREEEIARKTHFELQELPLVADLTHPDSPIAEDELIPSLLSETEATLAPALQLFDEIQIAAIYNEASLFLRQRDPEKQLSEAWQRLALIEQYYRSWRPDSRANQE